MKKGKYVKKENRPFSARSLSEFCRQTGAMVGAGIPLTKSLEILSEDENIPSGERKVYAELLIRVRQGTDLSQAMEERNGTFPPLLVHMFRAAELGGKLEAVAENMAGYYDKQHQLNTKVRNATLYPRILFVMIVLVTVFMLAWILPGFSGLFSRMEELPLSTRILFGISDFVMQNGWFLLGAAALGVLFFFLSGKSAAIQRQKDRCRMHLPIIGPILKTVYTARFSRTLSSLYAAGIPILQGLEISRKIIGNAWIDFQFENVLERVRYGEPLSAALEEVDGLLGKLATSVRVGEESGSLGWMLESIADALDYEAGMAIDRLITMLEPILVILMGGIVGFIMLAVMQPIYGSFDTLGL